MCAVLTSGIAVYEAREQELLGGLRGLVLEIGAGAGANFGHLSPRIAWLGLEPRARRPRRSTATASPRVGRGWLVAAVAERTPCRDASVDAVVSTLVLCSVANQSRALAEIRRVLRRGGSFVFFEHLGAPVGTWARRAQRCWAPLSRRLDAGCDPSRDTRQAIDAAGFREVRLRAYSRGSGVYGPFIAGTAHV